MGPETRTIGRSNRSHSVPCFRCNMKASTQFYTRKHSSRMRTDRAVTSSHEADCGQNDWHTPVKTLPSLAVGNKPLPVPVSVPASVNTPYTIYVENIRQTSNCLTNAMSASYNTTYVGFNSSSVLIKLNGSEDPCSGCRITPGSDSMLYPLDNPAS